MTLRMPQIICLVTILSIVTTAYGAELLAFRVIAYHSIFAFSLNDEFIPVLIEGSEASFRLAGQLSKVSKVAMTASTSDCTILQEGTISDISLKSDQDATTTVKMPTLTSKSQNLYFCFQASGNTTWAHQGTEDWAYIIVEQRLLSLPLIIVLIICCLCLSGLMNGLVLGLMSLDITELKVIANAGGEKEKKYGKAILSVRKRGNFLLISLVVGATSLNSTVTVLVDLFVSEWMTVVIVTLTIVLFCEIIPNSIVSRFALTIGAKTIYLTWMVMILTSPVSYPLGKLLDKLLGEDIPNLTRDRLKELVKLTANVSSLKKTEIDMISGALEMSAKKVEDIMTLMDDVYSIPIETLLDYETIREIIASGYSRIPIYDGDKSNIIKIMYVRDLALIDPEDRTPLGLFAKLMTDQELVYVDEGTTIDAVFNIFKEGVHGHMAFVVEPRKDGDTGPPVVTGLLTLEDIIEEIVQVEIVDEHDVIIDNRSRRKRQRYRMISDYMSVFAENFETKNVLISPNLRIAALSFLVSELREFSPELISPKVMQRLLRQGVIVHLPKKKPRSLNPIIFSQSQAQEGFVMILEGRAQIVIGPDNLRCECGPFSYFGLGILGDPLDDGLVYGFAVEAIGELRYLKIPRELYQAAIEATKIENGQQGYVPYLYRGLLADEDERELGIDASRITHFAEGRATSTVRKDDSSKIVTFMNQSKRRLSSSSPQKPGESEASSSPKKGSQKESDPSKQSVKKDSDTMRELFHRGSDTSTVSNKRRANSTEKEEPTAHRSLPGTSSKGGPPSTEQPQKKAKGGPSSDQSTQPGPKKGETSQGGPTSAKQSTEGPPEGGSSQPGPKMGGPKPPEPPHSEQKGKPTSPEPPHSEQTGKPTSPEPLHSEQKGKPTSPEPPHSAQTGKPTSPEPPHSGQTGKPTSPEPPHSEPTGKPTSPEPPHSEQTGKPTSPEPPHSEQTGKPTSPEPPRSEPTGKPTSPEPPHSEQKGKPTSPEPPHSTQAGKPSSPEPPHSGQTGKPTSPEPPHSEPTGKPSSPEPPHSEPTQHVPSAGGSPQTGPSTDRPTPEGPASGGPTQHGPSATTKDDPQPEDHGAGPSPKPEDTEKTDSSKKGSDNSK